VAVSSDSAAGDLDVQWIHGSRSRRHRTDPHLQVHAFRDDTFVVRQSKDLTYEAPFVFLLLGERQALLLDTGAVAGDELRGTVDALIADWLRAHPQPGYRLVVAHTHAHGDHVAGDAAFVSRDDTLVVGTSVDDVRAFFGFRHWPDEVVSFDLGERRLELVGIPGHEEASIAVYDQRSGLLFSGDSVYPGRIYVRDVPAFIASLNRLVSFAESRAVTHVLGCHIEMTRTPRRDYPLGCRYQPDEPPLQMTLDDVRALQQSASSLAGKRGVHRFANYVLYLGMGPLTQARLLARGLTGQVGDWLTRR
jgi:hydroxyacylglutathione hydrolase